MPEGCLTKECRNCDWHVVVGGRLDCNYRNRLGLKGAGVEAFTAESEEELLLRKYEAKKKELEEIEEATRELEEARKVLEKAKLGGDKGES